MKDNNKLKGSYKDNPSVLCSFCNICKGRNRHSDNSIQQANVRADMQKHGYTNGLPADCPGDINGKSRCRYA